MNHDPTRRPSVPPRGLAAALLGAVLLPAPARGAPPPVTIKNLGLHAEQFALSADGAFVFFTVDEQKQGGADRNGDGDAADQVLHVHDTAGGTTTNLGLAVTSSLAVDGRRVAFHLAESEQGLDANGDGDFMDVVPHVFDADLFTVTNLGIAGSFFPPQIDGDRVLFEVLESAEGLTDLNGDGDVFDSVLHAHDLASSATTNLGLAARASFGGPTSRLDGDRATVIVGETDQGQTDLNGDGDAFDGVAFVIDLTTGGHANLGLAVAWTDPALLFGDTVVVLVDETEQGKVDLNGDGDPYDLVLHLHRPTTPPIKNLGLAALEPVLVEGTLVFSVSEPSQGGIDFNGDGDGKDLVLFTHDLATDETHDLGLASVAPLVDEHWFAFAVYEGSQGNTDLNGDGDAIDWVLHVHDVANGLTTNLATEGTPNTFQRRRIGYLINESQAGPADLNGDGDVWIGEQVPHVYDLLNDTVRNLGVAAVLAAGADDRVIVRINEQIDGGVDRNGDGDDDDDVLTIHESVFGTTIDLALDGAGAKAAKQWVAFTVSEQANGGVDRNGDADADDWVLHVAHVEPGVCGSIVAYGEGCPGSQPTAPELLMRGCARPDQPIAITLIRGAPYAAAFVTFGAQRAELPMGAGCTLLVSPPLPLFLGPMLLSPLGSTRLETKVPSVAPSGFVRMQALVLDGSSFGPIMTNAVEFEIE